ncbi:MAG: 30S ribosomal protein S16 [Acidobacteria bacterium]|nr:30S ribosomal protein S16 [Acidobacteriota bacterium]
MPVKIRLTRVGKKKQPSYRVVVMDSRKPRDGKYIEQIGRYDPRQEPSLIEINNERALDWLHKGAQPTDRARKLLEITGAWAQFRVDKGEIHTVGEHAPTAYPEKAEEVASDQSPVASSEEEAGGEVVGDELPAAGSEEEAADAAETASEGSPKEAEDTAETSAEKAEEVASDKSPVASSEEEATDAAETASEGSPKEAEDTAETSAEKAADVAEEENSEDA